jgi:hypothetical protein
MAKNDLLNQLKTVFDKPTEEAAPSADSSKRAAGTIIPPGQQSSGRAEKITATIYAADWRRLDEIKDFFRQMGYRNLSDSEALRVACRAVHINDELVSYYEEMRKEDNRRKPNESRKT